LMPDEERILVVVHPGSACGSADFNLGTEAGPAREALAVEIMTWPHAMLVVDGDLNDEIEHYAMLAIALENAGDVKERKMIRVQACDPTEGWPEIVGKALDDEWPGGPHDVLVTGAWVEPDDGGCVNAVVQAVGRHRVAVAPTALRLP
jgi:hypothetical protein